MTREQRRWKDKANAETASWAYGSAMVTVRRDSTYPSLYVPVMRRQGTTNEGYTMSRQTTIGPTRASKSEALEIAVQVLDGWESDLRADGHYSEVKRNTRQTVTFRWDRAPQAQTM